MSNRIIAWVRGILPACMVLLATSTVHAGGIDVTPHGTQPGLAVQLDESTVCAGCHGGFNPTESQFMPHSTWSGSLMANAGRDPLFWAALDVANRDAPGVGDWCLRCHAPQGWYGGRVRKNGQGGVVNGTDGCLLLGDYDDPKGEENDFGGLTCHFCHRMKETGPSGPAPDRASGNVWLDDSLSCDGNFGPCRFGPFSYHPGDPNEPPHAWAYSRFTTSSQHCGTCHDVSSPLLGTGQPLRKLVLNDGTLTDFAFPAERTYSEWKQSRFGEAFLVDSFEDPAAGVAERAITDCQDCHMRKSSAPTARACQQNPPGSRAGQLSVHEFAGGNPWIVRILKGLYGSPAQLDREAAFDRSAIWAEEMLTQNSANLALTLQPWTPGAGPLVARVTVTNKAGHKLPTGYSEGRRMWISVVARDAQNNVVFQSGAWNPATGVLTEDSQVKVYEVLQGQWNATTGQCVIADSSGRKQFHFVLNNCINKDNRIPPEGFTPATAADPLGVQLRPVGYTYPETAPGSGILVNHDTTSYSIALPADVPRPVSVTATLRFQVASKDYIEFLRNQAVENNQPSENMMCGRSWTIGPANKSRGEFMYDLWQDPAYGRSPPVDMVSATVATP
jgi:hypothetical protein